MKNRVVITLLQNRPASPILEALLQLPGFRLIQYTRSRRSIICHAPDAILAAIEALPGIESISCDSSGPLDLAFFPRPAPEFTLGSVYFRLRRGLATHSDDIDSARVEYGADRRVVGIEIFSPLSDLVIDRILKDEIKAVRDLIRSVWPRTLVA